MNITRAPLRRTWVRMQEHPAVVLLLLCSAVAGQHLEKYCKISPWHTMCQTTGIGPACGADILKRSVTQEDTAAIVRTHNVRRALVAQGGETAGAPGPQPMAANMLQMEWDEELALIAQRHADQCVFEHDCSDCRKVDRFSVGQNLYTESRSNKVDDTDWRSVIDDWYEEVNEFPNTAVQSYVFTMSTGHYTQLVWGSTSKVGCGFTMYREGRWYKKLYTCNYGPAGNYIVAPMYQPGPPCSRCPVGTYCSNAYPGLCGSSGTSMIYTKAERPPHTASVATTSFSCVTLLLCVFTYIF